MLSMSKLTQLSVEAGSLLLEVATDLSLEPGEREKKIKSDFTLYLPGIGGVR